MESAKLGVIVGDGFNSVAPPRAQLLAYRAAEWGGFGFGVVGTLFLLAFFFIGTLSYLSMISDYPLSLPSRSRSRWEARQ